MLNEVVFEGMIAREPWTYDKDLFFRVASYRDADMPAKPDVNPGRDEPDYMNIRIPGGATSLMGSLTGAARGTRVRVHGFLQSRDFKESLTDFLEKARKSGGELPDIKAIEADKIKIDRGITEIVANRVLVIADAPKRASDASNRRSAPAT